MISLDNRHLTRGIRFENVSFHYGGSATREVLKHINIEIPLGKTTVIVGVSGSGKNDSHKTSVRFLLSN